MNKINTDPNKIDEILNRGTIVEILPTKKEFREKSNFISVLTRPLRRCILATRKILC